MVTKTIIKFELQCNIYTRCESHTRVEPTSEDSTIANQHPATEINIKSDLELQWAAPRRRPDPVVQSRVVARIAEGSS